MGTPSVSSVTQKVCLAPWKVIAELQACEAGEEEHALYVLVLAIRHALVHPPQLTDGEECIRKDADASTCRLVLGFSTAVPSPSAAVYS